MKRFFLVGRRSPLAFVSAAIANSFRGRRATTMSISKAASSSATTRSRRRSAAISAKAMSSCA